MGMETYLSCSELLSQAPDQLRLYIHMPLLEIFRYIFERIRQAEGKDITQ